MSAAESLRALSRLLPERVRHASWLRLALLPDELNLVHFVIARDPTIPRVMFDVGAHIGSSLRPFVADGWRVVAFEPDPINRAELIRRHGKRTNLTIDPRALSDRCEDSVPFFGSHVSTGISSLLAFHPSHEARATVTTTTLERVVSELRIDRIGLLKTDVEGYDLIVLRGGAWDRMLPEIVVCEFEDAKTLQLGYDHRELAEFLVERGYQVLVSEWYPVVRYGAAHRWRRLVRWPCALTDTRAFGNLIACRDPRHAHSLLRIARALGPFWRSVSRLLHNRALRRA